MEFETNPAKEAKILVERSFELMATAAIFAGRILDRVDDRQNYGEERRIAIGCIGEDFFTVVYTDRGDVRHLITSWRSNGKERKAWLASV